MDLVETSVRVSPGSHVDVPLQCFALGGAQAQYNPDDTLSAEVWGAGQAVLTFAAAASWYTARKNGVDRQTGYDQGQVVGTVTSAQSATLQPTARYFLRIFRSTSGEREEIATVLLKVRMPSPS